LLFNGLDSFESFPYSVSRYKICKSVVHQIDLFIPTLSYVYPDINRLYPQILAERVWTTPRSTWLRYR